MIGTSERNAISKAIELNGAATVRRVRFGTYTVPSASTADVYTVTVTGTDYQCDCPAGMHGRACWHKAAVLIAKTEQSGRARVVKPAATVPVVLPGETLRRSTAARRVELL
jgi:hypothetical protein